MRLHQPARLLQLQLLSHESKARFKPLSGAFANANLLPWGIEIDPR